MFSYSLLFPVFTVMTCDYYYELKTPFSKKPLNHSHSLDFLRKIFCVLCTQREVINLNFLNRPRGDFHFMFCSPLKLRLNQIKCDATGENPMNEKMRKTRKTEEEKEETRKFLTFIQFSLFQPPKRVEKSVHRCKRQATTTRKRSSKFCESSSSSSMCSDEYKTKYKQIQSKAFFRFT